MRLGLGFRVSVKVRIRVRASPSSLRICSNNTMFTVIWHRGLVLELGLGLELALGSRVAYVGDETNVHVKVSDRLGFG